jgi:hypothetical protein
MAARVSAERLIGTAFLVFAFATTSAGVLVSREWSAVGSALATLGLLWTLSGFAMVVSAVWLILVLPLGRQRPFRWRRKHLVGNPHHGWVFDARRTLYRASVSTHLPGLRRRSDTAGNSLPFNGLPEVTIT